MYVIAPLDTDYKMMVIAVKVSNFFSKIYEYTTYSVTFSLKDIDECEEKTDKCDHICTNTDGSYTCRCYARGHFWLNDDGHTCDS